MIAQKRVLSLFAAIFVASATAQIVPHPASGDATIQVDLKTRASGTIPRTIFGTFLEPIGNSTYNGLWAEVLENGSFEAGLWDVRHIEQMVEKEPLLQRSSELGLPLPWLPLDPKQGNRYEFRYGDAANSARSLEIMGVPGEKAGLVQPVYLPVQRQLTYKGSLYLRKLSGAGKFTVEIATRGEQSKALASVVVDASASKWTKMPFTLTLHKGDLAALQQAEFRIVVEGDLRVLVDQVSLMPADAVGGLDPDEVESAREMHTPLIRFGGNFTSGYHWTDGIGPIDKRVSMPNVAWGIPEYNTFGTDEFLHFCSLVDAEPQIALNLGSGMPQEAAGWVKYVNEHWKAGKGGLLLELGNELWGTWNTGWPTLSELAPRTLAFSRAIHAVDPNARLIATGQDPDHFEKWNAAQLANPVGTMNYLSTHFVETTTEVQSVSPTPAFVMAATLALPIGLEDRLLEMHKQIEGTAHKDVKTAFTEWLWVQGGEGQAPRYDNFAGALTTAGMFNMLMRVSDDVPISDMTGIMEFAGIWKKRGVVYRTPAAYVFSMYAGAPVDHLVKTTVESGSYDVHKGSNRIPEIAQVPYLDVDAALSKEGQTLTLFVVNRSEDRDISTKIDIAGLKGDAEVGVQSLRAADIYSGNDEVHPTAVRPETSTARLSSTRSYSFPRMSFTVLSFKVSQE